MYERIRNFREDKDWSQEAVATYLNIHQTTYSNYELGKTIVSVEALIKLADLYKTSIDYLVGRTDEPTPYPRKKKTP